MRRLPLFPLPVVLFPGATMPLHIFEPRYRQMVARCIEYDRKFGLVYHDPDRLGPFEASTERVGTVARIGEFRILPDGRSLLLAHGEERFRIVDGIESETRYLEALVEPVEDDDLEEGADPGEAWRVDRRRRTLDLLDVVLDRLSAGATRPSATDEAGASEGRAYEAGAAGESPQGDGALAGEAPGEEAVPFPGGALPRLDPATDISFSVAAMIRTDPFWQYHLLEAGTEAARLDQIDALLREALAAGEPDAASGPDDGSAS